MAALAAASTVGVGLQWWNQPAGEGYRQLSVEEALFLDALAEAAFPTGGEPALGGGKAGVSWYMDAVLVAMEPFQADLLKLSFHALNAATLPTHGAHFTALSPKEASIVLENWLASPIPELRGTATSVYLFIGMAYTSHPDVAPLLSRHFRCGYGHVETG
jgi:hypothetical protein